MGNDVLLSVKDLRKWYRIKRGLFGRVDYVRAVDGVSFDLRRGDAVSLVGESGSGKTTLGRTILGLEKPTSGTISFDGKNLTTFDQKTLAWYRKDTGFVQQDPYGALPPFMTVQRILEEPMIINNISKDERRERVFKVLNEVKLTPVEDFLRKYPHMLSGGQQQRVVIARAMILNPKLIIADEPVSMLDASVRIEILTLLRELQKRHDLSIVYITHDLSTTRYFSEWIYVMYAGKIIEKSLTGELLKSPLHPYTRALLQALPDPDAENRFTYREIPLGEPPSLINPPAGCRFNPRCTFAIKGLCDMKEPPEIMVEKDHLVSCWLYEKHEK
ncbi:MAG: ABC transporter ATP-binding protein [Nitrososphaerota archaeon]|nr:ABC transporter ATP-binding protein [Candidatus Bathyarchaeota archaeon]MDW8049056.1 ABC transporter ATP-binding protein [Nitrososphaerota archaeon]